MPIYSYALFVAVALVYAFKQRERLRLLFADPIRLKADSTLTVAERWTVAAGADLAARNIQYLDALDTGLGNSMQILDAWWGIDGRQTALETLHQLAHGDHEPADDEPTARAIAASLAILRQDGLHIEGHAPPSLLAWDLARLINISRWSYDAGLLSAEEAWAHLLPAARRLQREYSSWAQLSTAYLFGYLVWQDGAPGAEYEVLKRNRSRLLMDPRSPWRTIPWLTSLEAVEAVR